MIRIGDNVNGQRNWPNAPVRTAGRALQRASSDQQTHDRGVRFPARRSDSKPLGTRFCCRSQDGVELSHIPGRTGGPAFVIGHGFTHGVQWPFERWPGRDPDLDAAMTWTRAQRYDRVTMVGFSMGAAVALRQSAIGAAPLDAVAAVSAPSRWYMRESVSMRKSHGETATTPALAGRIAVWWSSALSH